MKVSCKSLVELEFSLEEVYKATTDQLDWNNPEGQQYQHDLLKPLPLIPNPRGISTNLWLMLINDKIILDTYGDTATLKRRRDDEDKDEEPSVGSDQDPKEDEQTTSESTPAEEPLKTTQDLEEPSHQEFETCAVDDQPISEASQHPEWFQKQTKPPTPDCAWNKTLPATHESIQPWISDLAKQADSRTSFNELMDTPLMKVSCKSLVELEFSLEEVYKATTDQLDWNNPEGQQYQHDLLKPLPLIPNPRGCRIIPFDYFINNGLRGGASSRKESARDVYSKRRIIAVTELQIVEWHNYKHLDWINVRRDDDKLYKFKEGYLKKLRVQDIEDMTIDMTIDQKVALDEALVPHASRLRIGKTNFCLRSDITSKESTLQVVYDVLRLTPFYKAFLVTADMNNKKRIVTLKYFREMLHICLRIPNQTSDELSFEEEILAFLRYLRHGGEIKKIIDDFVYQVKHKDAKKSNEMYYPRFTKVIINFFMTKDPSILRRNKFAAMLPVELTNEDIKNFVAYKEYYAIASGAAPPKTKASVRKTQSSSDTTMPPPMAVGTRLSTLAKGKQPVKSYKAKGLYVLSKVALTKAEQMKLASKRSLQQTHISQASGSSVNERTGIIPGVLNVPTYESDEEISWKSRHVKMEVKRRSVKVKDLQERCIKKLSSYQIKKVSKADALISEKSESGCVPANIAAGYTLFESVSDVVHNCMWMWPSSLYNLFPSMFDVPVPSLVMEQEDFLVWKSHDDVLEEFSIRNVWHALRKRGEEVDWYHLVWSKYAIPRHAIHLWLVMRKQLKAQDRLRH
nr:reverse transcriptase domain, reverse transcriptase zinc-binding domain protein [Tanacetum cinerariifolium]